jgi:hypothetical protein
MILIIKVMDINHINNKGDFMMDLIKDERGQGAAEYILLFGGVIVVAIAGLMIYRSYFNPGVNPFNSSQDISKVRSSV